VDAKKNLRTMYDIVKKHEEEDSGNPTLILPKSYNTKRFEEKLNCV